MRGPPLGLLPNVSYDRMIVKPDLGDLIVLYSAETFGVQLGEAVGECRGGNVPEDDETIIVLQRLSRIIERA